MHTTCSNLDMVAWSIGLVWISKAIQFPMTAIIICFRTNNINRVGKILFPHGDECTAFDLTPK